MARRSRGIGLSAYFGYTAFDVDVDLVGERYNRAYLEHRLAQVELWMPYLVKRLADRKGRPARMLDSTTGATSEALDLAYLQAVRRALHDALKAL